MTKPRARLSTEEVTELLGIKPQTLYAYVSRGLLTRHREPGDRRSWFDPTEVDQLAAQGRSGAARRPDLRIRSALTTIDGRRYFFRGEDAAVLARERGFEAVAEFLWSGTWRERPIWLPEPDAVRLGQQVQSHLPEDARLFDRLPLVTAALGAADPFRNELERKAVCATVRRLLATLVEVLPARRDPVDPAGHSIARRLWDRLSDREPREAEVHAIDVILALLADHELAASTFAVRIAASFRADPYGALGAGFGVLSGAWHGAVSVAAEALLREVHERGRVEKVVADWLNRGERLPGFGHPLYPEGDPRARVLLDLLPDVANGSEALGEVQEFLEVVSRRGLPPPNVDIGLAALSWVMGLAPGSGEVFFALARMTGWTAHAIEEYEERSDLRPRALYTGIRPKRD